jgi:hypothetical protein
VARAVGKKAIYLVERCGLEGDWSSGLATARPEPERERDWLPVLAFTTRQQAEAASDELERQARLTAAPWLFTYLGELEPISERSEEDWLAAVADIVGRAPTREEYPCRYGGVDWHAWWRKVGGELNDGQRLALWELCDLRFYRVSKVPLE